MRGSNETVTQNPKPDFGAIHFGYASAEEEGTNEPQLLLRGFYDADGITDEILNGSKHLILGYKGSGKSAIGERLRLLGEQQNELFTDVAFLSDFPFSQFSRVLKSSEPTEAEVHYPAVWTWVLLLKILESFAQDEGGRPTREMSHAVEALKALGLLPAKTLKHLVLQSSKSVIKASIPKIFEVGRERTYAENDGDFLEYAEYIKSLTGDFRSSSKHVLILDGLDDILTLKNLQYQVLSALVFAVSRLNLHFRQNAVPAKIVLLCRTDLFSRLPGPNKNKLRRDAAIELDWYHDPRDPRENRLVRLANLRSHLSNARINDLFDEFFPSRINGRDARLFIAEHTRHTPRDFLQLLTSIQKYAGTGPLSTESILKGVREYSMNYFLPEIRDELDGYASPAQIDTLFSLLGALRRKDFYLSHLNAVAAKNIRGRELDIERMIELLFECSAIGNVDPQTGYHWFKFRNRQSTVNLNETLVLHFGLLKALNLA